MFKELYALSKRSLLGSFDMTFVMWQILAPIVFVYIGGYTYSSLLNEEGIKYDNLLISLPAYLAGGLIGYNVIYTSTVSGTILWNDKRNGMFNQIMAMPFTRMHYVASNLLAVMLMAFASGILILVIGLPTFLNSINPLTYSLFYAIYALVIGTIFFGSLIIIICTKVNSYGRYNLLTNLVFLLSGFVSNAFFPVQEAPEIVRFIFYLNPMTYIVDITRAGLFAQINWFTNVEIVVMSVLSSIAFVLAVLSIMRMKL